MIYTYRCNDCGNTFETEHGMHEKPVVRCKACGGKARKVMTCPGIVFNWDTTNDFDAGVVVGPERYRGPAVPQSLK